MIGLFSPVLSFAHVSIIYASNDACTAEVERLTNCTLRISEAPPAILTLTYLGKCEGAPTISHGLVVARSITRR